MAANAAVPSKDGGFGETPRFRVTLASIYRLHGFQFDGLDV